MSKLKDRYEEMIKNQPIEEVKEWIIDHKISAKVPKAAKKNNVDIQKILGKRTNQNLE